MFRLIIALSFLISSTAYSKGCLGKFYQQIMLAKFYTQIENQSYDLKVLELKRHFQINSKTDEMNPNYIEELSKLYISSLKKIFSNSVQEDLKDIFKNTKFSSIEDEVKTAEKHRKKADEVAAHPFSLYDLQNDDADLNDTPDYEAIVYKREFFGHIIGHHLDKIAKILDEGIELSHPRSVPLDLLNPISVTGLRSIAQYRLLRHREWEYIHSLPKRYIEQSLVDAKSLHEQYLAKTNNEEAKEKINKLFSALEDILQNAFNMSRQDYIDHYIDRSFVKKELMVGAIIDYGAKALVLGVGFVLINGSSREERLPDP